MVPIKLVENFLQLKQHCLFLPLLVNILWTVLLSAQYTVKHILVGITHTLSVNWTTLTNRLSISKSAWGEGTRLWPLVDYVLHGWSATIGTTLTSTSRRICVVGTTS